MAEAAGTAGVGCCVDVRGGFGSGWGGGGYGGEVVHVGVVGEGDVWVAVAVHVCAC